jgi:hypothetical protein
MHKENDSRVALAFDPGDEALSCRLKKTLFKHRLQR